jgi:hypothetical protein
MTATDPQAALCDRRRHSSKPMRAEASFAQRHERALLDPAAEVSSLRVANDLTRIAGRIQVAGDDVVEWCSFRAGDLDDSIPGRRERHLGDDGCNVVRRDGLEQAGRNPDLVFPSALEAAMPPRNSRNWVDRTMV